MIPIGNLDLDIGAALSAEPLLGLSAKLFNDLNAVHLASKLSENSRLVAKTGADLEDRVIGSDVKQVRHQRRDIRRLVVTPRYASFDAQTVAMSLD